jgi:LCP family protein required for cell wall assembly
MCAVLSIILFFDGIFMLNSINSENKSEPQRNYNPVKIENIINDQDTGIEDTVKQKEAKSINLLVLGLDEEEIRSDVIALLNYNPDEGKLNMLSIARDTRISEKNRFMKINALIGNGGEKKVIDKVEEITDLNVDYYLTLNFKGFKKIIDILGGVEIEVPIDMNYDDPVQNLHINLKKGKQILDGEKAEQFVRYRKGNQNGQGYKDGDIGRIEAQQMFVKEFIRQKLKLKYILKADSIFYTIKKNMRTNIEIKDMNNILNSIKNLDTKELKTYTLPGDSLYIDNQWYYVYNRGQTIDLIKNNF